MTNFPIIFGQLNKKLFLPLFLSISQIIYIIINNYYLEKQNELILHMFLISMAQIAIKLFPFILKININVDKKEKPIQQKKCLHYSILSILFLSDWVLIGIISSIEIKYMNAKTDFAGI